MGDTNESSSTELNDIQFRPSGVNYPFSLFDRKFEIKIVGEKSAESLGGLFLFFSINLEILKMPQGFHLQISIRDSKRKFVRTSKVDYFASSSRFSIVSYSS